MPVVVDCLSTAAAAAAESSGRFGRLRDWTESMMAGLPRTGFLRMSPSPSEGNDRNLWARSFVVV